MIIISIFLILCGGILVASTRGFVQIPVDTAELIGALSENLSADTAQALANMGWEPVGLVLLGGGLILLFIQVFGSKVQPLVLEAPPVPPLRLDHPESEVTHGGDNRFHQIAFDYDFAEHAFNTEKILFDVISGLAVLLAKKGDIQKYESLSADKRTASLYLDLLAEAPHVSYEDFQKWLQGPVAAFQRVATVLRKQSLSESLRLRIPQLDAFSVASLSTLCATQTQEALEVYYDDLQPVRGTFLRTLSRALQSALQLVESSSDIQLLAAQKLGPDRDLLPYKYFVSEQALRSLNPREVDLFLQELDFPGPYPLFRQLPRMLDALFTELLSGSIPLTLPEQGLQAALAEPKNLDALLKNPKISRKLLQIIRSNKAIADLLMQARETSFFRGQGRQWLLSTSRVPRPAAELIASPRRIRRMISDPGLAKKVAAESSLPQELASLAVTCARRIKKRSGLKAGLSYFSPVLSGYFQFKQDLARFQRAREVYGLHPRRAGELTNLKLFRVGRMSRSAEAVEPAKKFLFDNFDRRAIHTIRNFAEEGRLLTIVPSGSFFHSKARTSRRTLFLFADLRNSTETTMRLTRDTAGYLAPYLTAVNTSAINQKGERIYFAGDGFASNFSSILSVLRCCWDIHDAFLKLRKSAEQEIYKRLKSRLRVLKTLPLQFLNPKDAEHYLSTQEAKLDAPTKEVLMYIVQSGKEPMTTDKVDAYVRRQVEAETMPMIEAGIGITAGDLIFALVGEAQEEKLKIVISPALTTAARLSGSSEEVEAETKSIDNFAFKAHAHNGKLFNRGVVLTEEVYQILTQEVKLIDQPGSPGIKCFYDAQSKRYFGFRRLTEELSLKGITDPVPVYEMIIPGCPAAKHLPDPTRR